MINKQLLSRKKELQRQLDEIDALEAKAADTDISEYETLIEIWRIYPTEENTNKLLEKLIKESDDKKVVVVLASLRLLNREAFIKLVPGNKEFEKRTDRIVQKS